MLFYLFLRVGAIGILTSGGDSPGMNAALRAAVGTACNLGKDIYIYIFFLLFSK
jgi:6-phosphofructokinase